MQKKMMLFVVRCLLLAACPVFAQAPGARAWLPEK